MFESLWELTKYLSERDSFGDIAESLFDPYPTRTAIAVIRVDKSLRPERSDLMTVM